MINYLRKRFTLKLRKENNILKYNILKILSHEALWIYTIPKSGTTYFLFILGNLLNSKLEKKDRFDFIDFDTLNKYFSVHSANHSGRHKNGIDYLINKKQTIEGKYSFQGVLATHISVPNDNWKYCVFLYRNPLDYLISCFHYFHVKRGDRKYNHPIDIKDIWIPRYIKEYLEFDRIRTEKSNNCLSISYEDLIRNTPKAMSDAVSLIGLECSEQEINLAIKNSSKENIRKAEKMNGSTIVAQKSKNYKFSFIRSGEIGEWKTVFSDRQVDVIFQEFIKNGIDPTKFTYE